MHNNTDNEPRRSPDLVDALTTAVILLDRKLHLVQVNSAAQSLFAISETRLKTQSLHDVLPGVEELAEAARRALAEGRSFIERDLEVRSARFDPVTVGYTVTPLWHGRSEPDFVLIEISKVDNHQRSQIEDNMSIQNNVTSALLQGMAHEIKNPLGGIRGAAQLLERELEDQKQAEYTQIIIGEVDRLRSLVDHMLGPRGESFRQVLNIHDVLEHVRQIVEAECDSSVKFIRDYDPSLPDIHADRDQLIQAFLNLFRNAVQAARDCGESITLRTRVQRQFTIGPKLHRLVVHAQIIDSGPGVDPEIASSIFIPLVSGSSGGSGLGLPIAHSLVHRQGGLIGFESKPGHTEFSVWLPVGEPN